MSLKLSPERMQELQSQDKIDIHIVAPPHSKYELVFSGVTFPELIRMLDELAFHYRLLMTPAAGMSFTEAPAQSARKELAILGFDQINEDMVQKGELAPAFVYADGKGGALETRSSMSYDSRTFLEEVGFTIKAMTSVGFYQVEMPKGWTYNAQTRTYADEKGIVRFSSHFNYSDSEDQTPHLIPA